MAKDLVRDWSWDGCLLALVQDHPVEQHLRLLRPLPVCIGGGCKAPHICTPVYPLAPPCSHASPSHHIRAVCYCVCCHCKYVPGWKLSPGIIEELSLASRRRGCVEPSRLPFASSFMRRSIVTPTGDVEASSLCIEASSLASSLYVEASRPGLR